MHSYDVSADLLAIRDTGATVVARALPRFYDPERTAEYCETIGLPIFRLGGATVSDYFSTQIDHLSLPARDTTFGELFEVKRASRGIGIAGGSLTFNSSPEVQHALDHFPPEIVQWNASVLHIPQGGAAAQELISLVTEPFAASCRLLWEHAFALHVTSMLKELH